MNSAHIVVVGSANMDLVVTVDRAPTLGETVTGRTFQTVPGGKGANQALAAARAGGAVLVTLGADGSVHCTANGAPVTVPAFAVEAVDTTAAGDTFVGAFAVADAEGRPVADAMRWASAAAALAVQRLGASSSMPARVEIEDFLAQA